jgi:hypothetical protein
VRRLGLPPEVLRFFTADKAAADVHVMRMDACGRHWMPDYGRMRRYAAGVNRLHALTELGLMPSASSVAPVAAFAAPGATPAGVGVPAPFATRGDGPTAPVRAGRRNVEDEADDEDEGEEVGAASGVVDPCGSAMASAPTGHGVSSSIGGDPSSARRTTPFVASPWSRLPPEAEARVAAVPPRYTRVIGIVPTGWVHTSKKKVHVAPCSAAPGYACGPAPGVAGGPVVADASGSPASCVTASGGMCADNEDRVTAAAATPARDPAVAASDCGRATSGRLPSSAAPDEAVAPGSGVRIAHNPESTAGATLTIPATSDDRFTWIGAEVHLIPYSEHSSFPELQAFVRALKPRKILPHVYSDAADRDRIVARFSHLLDSRAAKRAFFSAFGSGTGGAGALSNSSSLAVAGASAASQALLVVASRDGCKPASGDLVRTGETDFTVLDDEEDASEAIPETARMQACTASGCLAPSQTGASSQRRGAGAGNSLRPAKCSPPAVKKARTALSSPCALRHEAGGSALEDAACDDDGVVVVVDDEHGGSACSGKSGAAGAAAVLMPGVPISEPRRRTSLPEERQAVIPTAPPALAGASRVDFHCYACLLNFAAHASTSGSLGWVRCPCGSDFIERCSTASTGQGLPVADVRGSASSSQASSVGSSATNAASSLGPAAKSSPHAAPGSAVVAGRGARTPSKKATIGPDISSFFKH